MITYIFILFNLLSLQSQKYLISDGSLSGVPLGTLNDSFVERMKSLGFSSQLDSIESCIMCDEYDPVYYFYEDNQLLFRAEPGWDEDNSHQIFRIIVYSSKFMTVENIGVGKTLADLEAVYDKLEFYIDGETGIHLSTEKFSGSFGIELPKVDRWFELKLDSLNKSQKINEVVIVK